jgi:P-type Ca2+ transporter type 2C
MANIPTGLTAQTAAERLALDGPNELPHRDARSVTRIIAEVLREPMLALLLLAGLAYMLLGDRIEALVLLAFASFSVGISVIQEARSEKVLSALRDLSSPRALVIRDGVQLRVPGREVVWGDLILLEQGDRVPADGELIEASDLQVDESLLTGESVPVDKTAQQQIYSGTLVVRGSGLALTSATAGNTRIGQIGEHLATIDPEPPRLRRDTAVIVRLAGIGAFLVAGSVTLLFWLTRDDWLNAVLAGIATGMAMLPEEFPVVLATFLAMGAWRISQARVLTRRAAAIETLGSITVLCTDKTGTLTENRMTLAELWLPGNRHFVFDGAAAPHDNFHSLIEAGIMGSAPSPVDPMEIALHNAGVHLREQASRGELVHHFGLRPDLLAMSNVWDGDGNGALRLAAKGAPEAIARLCRLKAQDRKKLVGAAEAMAKRGIRVLGVASASSEALNTDGSQLDHHFHLEGLVGFADPLRANAPAAVAECQSAGIRVMMITGDYPATAVAIAAQAGIAPDDVHARIMPEAKLTIVDELKQRGEIVAMTGDGVNDAPSLKAAHVGIAMGGRGTDVAREASSLVLLDDDFSAIVKAIRLGRRIYANIRKAMAFIVSVHVPIAGLALTPLVLGQPLIFGPIHIALLEMIIDPACALVFEAEQEDADIMRRPPRDPAERLFAWPMVGWSLFEGGLAFAILAAITFTAPQFGLPPEEVRGLTFFSLVATTIALILVNRTAKVPLRQFLGAQNKPLIVILAIVALAIGAVMAVGEVQAILRFGSLHFYDVALALGAGLLLLVTLQLLKPFMRVGRMP